MIPTASPPVSKSTWTSIILPRCQMSFAEREYQEVIPNLYIYKYNWLTASQSIDIMIYLFHNQQVLLFGVYSYLNSAYPFINMSNAKEPPHQIKKMSIYFTHTMSLAPWTFLHALGISAAPKQHETRNMHLSPALLWIWP